MLLPALIFAHDSLPLPTMIRIFLRLLLMIVDASLLRHASFDLSLSILPPLSFRFFTTARHFRHADVMLIILPLRRCHALFHAAALPFFFFATIRSLLITIIFSARHQRSYATPRCCHAAPPICHFRLCHATPMPLFTPLFRHATLIIITL